MQHLESFRNNSKYWIANMFNGRNIMIHVHYTHHTLSEWARNKYRVKTLRKIMWHAFVTHDYTTAHLIQQVLSKHVIYRRKDATRYNIVKDHFKHKNHELYIQQQRSENTIPSIYILMRYKGSFSQCEDRYMMSIARALNVWFALYKDPKDHLKAFQIEQHAYNVSQHFLNPVFCNNYKITQ